MNILILFASTDGQTKKIAEYIATTLHKFGHHSTCLSVENLPDKFSPESYDAVIIGGSIRMGRYSKHLISYVKQHQHWLNNIPSILFTVCMAIQSKREKSRQEAQGFSDQFTRLTQWKPHQTAVFAGAVKYTQYGFFTRFILKQISRREGGSTDTSRDHEYTNWQDVENFTKKFSSSLS